MKFALRLTTLGVIFTVMFSVVGLSLWFIQVAEGPQIARAAEEATWVGKTTYAARGDIYDRNGTLLATSRMVPAVMVDRTFVQPEQQETLIQELASIVGADPVELEAMYEEAGINGRFQVSTVSNETAYAINESLDELPGVEVVKVPERVYLTGPTMAHVIGHLGLPEQADLDERAGPGSGRPHRQARGGACLRRGAAGHRRLGRVPGAGGARSSNNAHRSTRSLAARSCSTSTSPSRSRSSSPWRAASHYPTRSRRRRGKTGRRSSTKPNEPRRSSSTSTPSMFSPWLLSPTSILSSSSPASTRSTFDGLNETKAFNNLAVSGLYPPASTFKAITYTAKLEENLPFPTEVEGVDGDLIHCDGTLVLDELADGSAQVKHDWYDPRNLGWLDIHGALSNSCNIYFWNVALGTYIAYPQGSAKESILQDWATRVGYGHETGIDLTSEAPGIIPTRQLFEEWKEYQLENPDEPPRLEPARLELASPWLGGDLMDFAIGQGAFTATPLQVASSYAVLVNGGKVMEPRVVRETIDAEGNVTPVERPAPVTVDIDPATRASLLADLGSVVNGGTAAAAFSDFGEGVENVGGKTGTAQVSATRDNHAWFVGVAPLDNPKYVVAILIDEGGSGGQVAAPVARQHHAVSDGQRADAHRRRRGGRLMAVLTRLREVAVDRGRNKSDRILFGTMLALSAFGLLMVYSATRSSGFGRAWSGR